MKWSEQMRELLSVDENFNQLKVNINIEELLINGEFIAEVLNKPVAVTGRSTAYVLSYEDYNKIIKKYPFFTDEKFLLNCIFKRGDYITRACQVYYGLDYIAVQTSDLTETLLIYTVPQGTQVTP